MKNVKYHQKNQLQWGLRLILAMVTLVGIVLGAQEAFAQVAQSHYSDFNIPDTEVKFLIDAEQVLDTNGNLLPEMAHLFGGMNRDRGRRITMQFMDTPDQAFNADGWIHRIRYRHWNQPSEGYQLTYRRRVPIGSVNHANIRAAMDQAREDGFGDWDMNLDWSYRSAVLTLSYTVNTGPGILSPLSDGVASGRLLKDHMPAHVAALYSEAMLAAFDDVVVHGPVTFRRYEFNFPGTNERILRIEVLPIKTVNGDGIDRIVEVSFEMEHEGRLEVISARRDQIQGILEQAGILIPENGLRTSTILERYGR